MAKVPLTGLRIEVPHGSTPEQVGQLLQEFAEDIAQNKFPDWGVRISPLEGNRLRLAGGQDETHFEAEVSAEPDRAVVVIDGAIDIGRVKLALAGGPEGVRRRVADGIERTLRDHLAS